MIETIIRNALGCAVVVLFSAFIFTKAASGYMSIQTPKSIFDYPIHILAQVEVINVVV